MTDGVRRLSHDEAEMLISARMDEQLDRADSRALLVHLQSCESCRLFAVQSEILGRELAALPVLPPSAVVDRQIRESIANGTRRWSLAHLFPALSGNSGLRAAVGAVAILTLVSVFLLIRMAGNQTGTGDAIDAPNGGLAQQLDRTPTRGSSAVQDTGTTGPTETPRVVAPKTPVAGSTSTAGKTETQPVDSAVAKTTTPANVSPTATLDSVYVYTIDKTKTASVASATKTPVRAKPTPSDESGDVTLASVGGEEGTPVEQPAITVAPVESVAPTTSPESIEEPVTVKHVEPTVAPTMTATPVEISVASSGEPGSPSPQSAMGDGNTEPVATTPADATGESEQSATTVPEQPAVSPTRSNEETQPPAETPFSQPTIAPVSGVQSADDGHMNGNDQSGAQSGTGDNGANDTPPIVPSDGSNVEAASNDGSSPQIVSSNGSSVPSGIGGDSSASTSNTGENGTAGTARSEQPAAIPTADSSVEPSGLDLSDTVTDLPSGVSSPLGRLAFSPNMTLYAVFAPDGQLAVANTDGELVITLGAGDLPIWSGNAMMFSTPGDTGSRVGIWDSNSGDLSYIPSSVDEASNDLPIGGDGGSFYFLRTFPDRPGAMEIRSASIDGADKGTIWSSDSVDLSGSRPAWSKDGILLPTDSSWLLIRTDGSEAELGENTYGVVGVPVISPGGGLMAYSAGDQVIVAWTADPGTAVATAPFGGATGGYAFSTSGEQVVVSDGTTLHVVSYTGADLGSLGGNQSIGGVYWLNNTIYYLQIGEDAALKTTSLDSVQSS